MRYSCYFEKCFRNCLIVGVLFLFGIKAFFAMQLLYFFVRYKVRYFWRVSYVLSKFYYVVSLQKLSAEVPDVF